MPVFHDLLQERGAYRVYVMGRKYAGGEKVHPIVIPALLVVHGRLLEIQPLPEGGRVNAPVLDFGHGGGHGVDVVDGEQAGNLQFPGHGRNQPGHPVVAVNDVRRHPGHDVVDHFPLKRQRHLQVHVRVSGIHIVQIIERPVRSQVDPFFIQALADLGQLPAVGLGGGPVEYGPVIRQGHMHITAQVEQSRNQGRGYIRQPARLGGIIGPVAHVFRQIGNFRRHNQNSGFLCHMPPPVGCWVNGSRLLESDHQSSVFTQVIRPGVLRSTASPLGITRAVYPNRPESEHTTRHP